MKTIKDVPKSFRKGNQPCKTKVVNTELGKRKSDFTKEVIYLVLENWDFEADGKITQGKVADYTNGDVSTVKRLWSDFKAYAKDLNVSYHKPNKKKPDEVLKIRLEYQVYLYDLLPELSFSVHESMTIIDGLNRSKVSMKELISLK